MAALLTEETSRVTSATVFMSHSAKTMPMMPVMMMSAEASKPEAPVVTSSVHVAAADSTDSVRDSTDDIAKDLSSSS